MTQPTTAQLFLSNGHPVATVPVDMVDGKWPLIVWHEGHAYVLQSGRYVRSNASDGSAVGLVS